MRALLQEVVAVAQAQQIDLDFDERWEVISGLLGRLAASTKGSMLQDVERQRCTEIDVINGAIVEAGQRILLDPFLDDNPGSPVKSHELERVDLVIVIGALESPVVAA